MNVPVTLLRVGSPALAADAFLLPDADATRLGEVFAELRAVPQLFRVRGGFLLVPSGTCAAPAGLLRLRRVAAHVYIPVDAALSPAILPDEFPGLTRGGGLVLLPGESLAFEPTNPVPASAWLTLPPQRTGMWQPFPELPAGADVLRVIERPAPPAAVLEILGGGEPDDRAPLPTGDSPTDIAEDARPPSGSLLRRTAAGAAFGVGRAMAWLGSALGAGALARAGAGLARRAVDMVPRLSEKVLGAQEAALRALLRDLQSGDAEKALRRAPVATPDSDATPGRLSGNSHLSDHDTGYSFAELFRRSGGPASVWAGSDDIWARLRGEYRRLAEEAVKRGDYRRAAYLWGVLLSDLRTAANVLTAGGLYRDAAVLCRDKLNDPLGAAGSFELAGDYDEAVRLYEKCGEDLKAAELLRRIGDEARAELFLHRAAAKLAARDDHLSAGDLVRTKLGQEDLANGYYRAGWQAARTQAVACGERLIDDALIREDADSFDQLLAEAAVRFPPPATADAARLFNYALGVSQPFAPPDRVAALRDRARLLFADHLRAGGKKQVEALFGDSRGEWSPSVCRDAAYATAKQTPAAVAPPSRKAVVGTVRAVANALDAGLLFLGTNETVAAWDVRTGRTRVVANLPQGLLRGLCVDRTGQQLYALVDRSPNPRLIAYSISADGTSGVKVLAIAEIPCDDPRTLYLQPRCFDDPRANFVVVAADGRRTAYHAQMLTTCLSDGFDPEARVTNWVGEFQGRICDWSDGDLTGNISNYRISWQPASKLLDVHAPAPYGLILAGIDSDGNLHQTAISFTATATATASAPSSDKYNAVAVLPSKALAAVTRQNQLRTLRVAGNRLAPSAPDTQLDPASPVVFLGYSAGTRELAVVFENGSVTTISDRAAG